MIFPKWKHLWTYGMVDEPMRSSFLETGRSRLCCYAIKCPCLWASPWLESSKSCFRLNRLGRTWKQWCVWCCLIFPINVGRTNIYIYIYTHTYAAASSICFLYADMKIPLMNFSFYDMWRYLQICLKTENNGWCCVPNFKYYFAEVSRPSPYYETLVLIFVTPRTKGMMWWNMMELYVWQRLKQP